VTPAGEAAVTCQYQAVVMAVGADAEPEWIGPGDADPHALHLTHCALRFEPVLTAWGGDLTNRIRSVADAVASGKQAALALDACFNLGREAIIPALEGCRIGPGPALSMESYLGGDRGLRASALVAETQINHDYFVPGARLRGVRIAPRQRITGFEPVETPPSAERAAREARRCFNCGICNACDNCRIFCPEVAVSVHGIERRIELDYCKGCGICVAECPRRAMVMEQEPS